VRLTGIAFTVLAAGSGCSFAPGSFGVTADASAVNNDADRTFLDARPDAPPDSACYGTGLLVICYPNGQMPLTPYQPTNTAPISTSNDSNCDRIVQQGNGPELCVKTASSITINRDIRFSGTRPIVLLATGSISVTSAGKLDLAEGAGANTGTCMPPMQNGQDNTASSANAGAGGGGGGAFGSAGGGGGAGENGAAGGTGGVAVGATYIRGGCRGGNGGRSSSGAGGSGGNGGGGIYLIAGASISIAGGINASGGGGSGGANKAGGGGGGSGGLIGLDAPTVSISGTLFANGGGGGEGGGDGVSGFGGEDPGDWDEIPDGGKGLIGGGNGGNGAYRTTAALDGGSVGKGGGGGGAGLGRILVFSASVTLSSSISPAPQ
jgi:hypothetical protein